MKTKKQRKPSSRAVPASIRHDATDSSDLRGHWHEGFYVEATARAVFRWGPGWYTSTGTLTGPYASKADALAEDATKLKQLPEAGLADERLRDKLQALADHGIDGERTAAAIKLERHIARFMWRARLQTADIFAGSFERSTYATSILSFAMSERDIANAIKWAITCRTGISCLYREGEQLWAEVTPSGATRLRSVAASIRTAFDALWTQFRTAPGIELADRSLFIAGLSDGMMDDIRTGQALPSRPVRKQRGKQKPGGPGGPAGLRLHPYSIATGLGKQIRFSVPLEEVSNQLRAAMTAQLQENSCTPTT